MSTEYNFKHIDTICPECENTDILIDDYHQETYCTQCGLVIQDNTIPKITQQILFIKDTQEKNSNI